MAYVTYTEVSFNIEGEMIDLEKLTEEIGILPNEARTADDWPVIIKNNKSLPSNLQPRYTWSISYRENECKQIEIPVRKIIEKIKGREEKILKICKKYNLKKYICVVIQSVESVLPEIYLPADVISFLGKLELDVVFDVYA